MIYIRVVEELKSNKKIRLEGKDIAIPWLNLPKLSTVIPGVQKGRYIIVTANSKVGKTQIADYLFLYEPLNYIFSEANKGNLKLKIFYFSLEMSKEDKILQMISNKIYNDKQYIVSTDNLRSYFNGYILEDRVEKLIDEYKDYFTKVEEVVTFIDKIRNPFGIYKEIRDYARNNGKFFLNNGVEVDIEKTGLYDYYIPNDPNEQVIVITDHISLLTPEKGEDLHAAMGRYSSDYCLKMRDNFKYTVVNIQQQSASSEAKKFNLMGGKLIIDSLRPSADDLGDNKLTGRDADLLIGLFAPNRYKIKTYEGYDITQLKDNYRELSIIFNRRGSSTNLDLYFEGAANYFRELKSDEYRIKFDIE